MKFKVIVLLIINSFMCVPSAISSPTHWSRFIKTKSQDLVTISFRQKRINQAWLIEWHVKNDSDAKVEPILISRNYVCKNGESQVLNQQSLGVYFPGTHRKGGIKDKGICPNSKIKFVEIESEVVRLPLHHQTTVTAP